MGTSLGDNIRAARKALGLSQDDLGDMIGANRVTISKYENNVYFPSVPALRRIAEALQTTTAELEGVVEEKKEPASGGQVDGDIETMIQQYKLLSHQERQRVLDFAAGILSSREP